MALCKNHVTFMRVSKRYIVDSFPNFSYIGGPVQVDISHFVVIIVSM